MKLLNYIGISMAVCSAPAVLLADGHSQLSGHGTSVITATNAMEGTTGTLVSQTSNDIWMWDNPPDGYPTASKATCHQYIAFATGEMLPLGFLNVCQQVDVDGDISLLQANPQPDGSFLVTQIAGTGKWAPYTGAQWGGKTDVRIGTHASVYSFAPK